jgi:hypothetical protein
MTAPRKPLTATLVAAIDGLALGVAVIALLVVWWNVLP